MGTSIADIERWKNEGIKRNAAYTIIVCDTFEYQDYPVYVDHGVNIDIAKAAYNGINMQKIMEVIKLDTKPDNIPSGEEIANFTEAIKTVYKENAMNAKRARELTEQNILSSSNVYKEKVDSMILTAIKQKQFSITVSCPAMFEAEIIKAHYCGLGYIWKVNNDMRGDTTITISW